MRLHYILSEKQKQTNNMHTTRAGEDDTAPLLRCSATFMNTGTPLHMPSGRLSAKFHVCRPIFLLMSSISMKTDKMKCHAIIQYLKRKGFYPKAIYEGIVQTFVSE